MKIPTRLVERTRASTSASVGLEAVPIARLPVVFRGDPRRVIVRPLILGNTRVLAVFHRLAAFDERHVERSLELVLAAYGGRHHQLEKVFDEHFTRAAALTGFSAVWSTARRRLAGSYFTMEYAIDSAALFNPSMVPHFDQSNLPAGAIRFIMSLRATGEGHVSSIVFRTGVIDGDLTLSIDQVPTTLRTARVDPDRRYNPRIFQRKLNELGVRGAIVERVMTGLPAEGFTLAELSKVLEALRADASPEQTEALRTIQWLGNSNFHISLPATADLADLVIFPMSDDDAHGLEDLRLVRFIDEDGSARYYGTYTAYNGLRIMPMIMETRDFQHIEVHTLNGAAAKNKGFALFPRRINGRFVMCSRIDGENLFISYSDSVHFWETAQMLRAPKGAWELFQIGNCGSPIELPEGWLLLTHGVGPMRSYAIGALLLDKDDPCKVIGHLAEPLITPISHEREGYVPNVVYSCGGLIHGEQLFIPYAQSDHVSSIAVVGVRDLIERLTRV